MNHNKGFCYHVYNRSLYGKIIFKTNDNYEFLLRKIKDYINIYELMMISYCLLPNHYHMLIHLKRDNTLSPFIKRLFNSYTQAFNKQNHRRGTLFEGSAKIKQVDTDEYILRLSEYIHMNPVKAGLVKSAEEWPYSNYLEWIGKREGKLVSKAFVKNYFPDPKVYEEIVNTSSFEY